MTAIDRLAVERDRNVRVPDMRDREDSDVLLRHGTTASGATWRGGRLSAPQRLLVFLACDAAESDMLREAWEGQALDIESGSDLALALVRTGQWSPDMFVVGNGTGVIGPLDFVRTLRSAGSTVPVVVGVAEPGPLSAPEVLAAGATAVVRRPFEPGDVLRLLSTTSPGSFRIKPLPVDLGRLRVDGIATRMWVDGVECLIPAMEHLLLRYLAERHGQIVSRDELISVAWGKPGSTVSNSLAVHLGRVRRRLQEYSGTDWVRSVRGCGYQLVVPQSAGVRPAAVGV